MPTQFPAAINLASLNGANGFVLNGETANDYSGWSVSAAGDVNGDGIGDIIVGACGCNNNTGRSYVVFGSRLIGNGAINLNSLNGANGFVLNGEAADDYSGYSVSAAGDVNGDGLNDIIVGAHRHSSLGLLYNGRSYVVFGSRSIGNGVLNLTSLNGTNGFVLNGEATSDFSASSVSAAGDVNGDGVGDVIVGAFGHASLGLSDSGRSYVVFGSRSVGNGVVNLNSLNGANGFVLNGETTYDMSGNSVSAAGDVNGDGVGDVIVGAFNQGIGRSYVVFGSRSVGNGVLNLNSLNGANGFVLNGEAASDYSGRSVSAAGDVNGDGVGDVIVGAQYHKSLGLTWSGRSYVVFGVAPITSSPTIFPTLPSREPSRTPTYFPTLPSREPSRTPTQLPSSLPTNAPSVLSSIDPMPFNNTVPNAMIGGAVAGAMGLAFLGLKLGFTCKAKYAFEKAVAAASDANGVLQEQVIRPVAKEVFDHISITGCLGYISDDSMKQYMNAVKLLVSALDRHRVPIATLGTMTSTEKFYLLDEIVKQIKACCLSIGCCSTVGRLFRPSITSAMLLDKVDHIALAVYEHLQLHAMGNGASPEKHQYKNKKNALQSEIELSKFPVFLPKILDNVEKPYVWNPSSDLKVKNLEISAFGSRGAANQAATTEKDNSVSWYMDPAILSTAGAVQDYTLLPASKADMTKVVSSYQRSSAPGYHIGRVQVVYNPELNRSFHGELKLLNARHGKPAFEAKWKKEAGNSGQWRKSTHSILEAMAAPHKDPTHPHVTLLPMWHATKKEILPSLFSAGFANLAETDPGFFGKGIYSAGEAKYSWTVYGEEIIRKQQKEEPVLLMNWVAIYSAYPVIDGDMQQLMAGANVGNYDAHFVPVRPKDLNNINETTFVPCAFGQPYQYTELVVFNPRQCLARYVVELQSDLLPSITDAVDTEAKAMIEQANPSPAAALAKFGVMAHKAVASSAAVADAMVFQSSFQLET